MQYTIFSIDNSESAERRLQFEEYINLMPCISHNLVRCVGAYKGEIEPSWIMLSADFDNHVLNSVYVQKQESVLRVSSCNRAYALLEYLADIDDKGNGKTEFLGRMQIVSREEAFKNGAWTYRCDLDAYCIAVKDTK